MSIGNRFEEWRERLGGTSVLLSVLIHVALLVLILTDVLLDHKPQMHGNEDPPAVEVSLVPEPKRQLPPPPQQQPQPQAQPEQPKPEPEQQQPPMPMAKPAPPVQEPAKPPPKPVLQQGKLAKDSNAGSDKDETKSPKHSWLDDAKDDGAPKNPQITSPLAKATEAMTVGKGSARQDDNEGAATQSERDFLLAQILKPWHNRPNYDWGEDAVIRLRVQVLPDGYLAPPFNARQGYTPDLAIVGFHRMAANDPRRIMLESLYSVLRVAQPLNLPPELRKKAPFLTVLDFRLVDIP